MWNYSAVNIMVVLKLSSAADDDSPTDAWAVEGVASIYPGLSVHGCPPSFMVPGDSLHGSMSLSVEMLSASVLGGGNSFVKAGSQLSEALQGPDSSAISTSTAASNALTAPTPSSDAAPCLLALCLHSDDASRWTSL